MDKSFGDIIDHGTNIHILYCQVARIKSELTRNAQTLKKVKLTLMLIKGEFPKTPTLAVMSLI